MRSKRFVKIGVKLVISFIMVAIISGVVGVTGVYFIRKINQEGTELYKKNTCGVDYIAQAAIKYQRVRVGVASVVLEDSTKEQSITKMNVLMNEGKSYLESYEKNCVEDQKDIELLTVVKANWEKFSNTLTKLQSQLKANDYDSVKVTYVGELQNLSDALQSAFDNLRQYDVDTAKEKASTNEKHATNAILNMFVIIAIGMVLAVTMGLIIARGITKPIYKSIEVAKKISKGDVAVEVDVERNNEMGLLARAMKDMVDSIREQAIIVERIADGDLTMDIEVRSEQDLLNKKLKEMVQKNNEVLSNIAHAAEQVAAGSKQVSDSSIALSQGATEQASSIEQLTTSLEEISSQTKLNAQNADQASELAKLTQENAAKGNERMKEMQKAMDEINLSSTNISKIIKVIDEIAFQTNILALNAAVEAARAGQHGKGFAVVAEEVRNLAARSANAAKETTDLIEGSIGKVVAGTQIANETADALNKIVEDITKASSLVGDIAIASNEQASGITQVNQGIMQVSQVVQTNSATSEEGAAASEELSSQAVLLKEAVDQFKLKKEIRANNRYSELSPEILKVLEDMTEKSQKEQVEAKDYLSQTPDTKIILNDSEFGKY